MTDYSFGALVETLQEQQATRDESTLSLLYAAPIHISTSMPTRILTIVHKNGNRYQLRRRFRQIPGDLQHGFTRVYEVVKLGHHAYPLTVGWLAYTPSRANTAVQDGWYKISGQHATWVPVDPLWRDSAWCQDLWDGVNQIVRELR